MTDEELDKLAKELAPFMAEQLLGTIAIAGTSLRLKIGNNVYPTNTIFNTSSGIITIEDDVFFGHNVCVLTGTHDMTKKGMARINSFPKKGRDIIFVGVLGFPVMLQYLGLAKLEKILLLVLAVLLLKMFPRIVYTPELQQNLLNI
jgi:hypothetical protein